MEQSREDRFAGTNQHITKRSRVVEHEEDVEYINILHQTTFLQPYPEPTVPDSSYVLSSTTVSTTLHPLALRSRTDSLRSPYIDQQPQALLLSPPPQQQIHQIIQPSDANFVENAIGVLRELSRELYNLEEDNLRLKKQQKILDEQIGELQQSDRQQRSRKRRYSDLVSVVLHERDFPAFMPFVLNRADAPFVVLKPIFVPGSPHIKLIGLAFSPAVCKLLGWPEEELLGDEEEKIRPFTPTESNEYDNSKNDSLFMLAQQGQVARVSSTMLVNTVAHGVDGVPRDATLRIQLFFNELGHPHFVVVALLRWERRVKQAQLYPDSPFVGEKEFDEAGGSS